MYDRFRLLTDGSRSAPLRHQTLRATVDYSHELCSEPARLLWARMSVFAGGSSLEAILSVCADEELNTVQVEEALAELVDKSIVRFDGSRYHILETIREYGRERLQLIGRERAAVRVISTTSRRWPPGRRVAGSGVTSSRCSGGSA
jgi:predicted ATPase